MPAGGRSAAHAGEPPSAGAGASSAAPRPDPQTALGWAWTDRQAYAALAADVEAAPASIRPALHTLLLLYGLSRIEAGAECYLSMGGLQGGAGCCRAWLGRSCPCAAVPPGVGLTARPCGRPAPQARCRRAR